MRGRGGGEEGGGEGKGGREGGREGGRVGEGGNSVETLLYLESFMCQEHTPMC